MGVVKDDRGGGRRSGEGRGRKYKESRGGERDGDVELKGRSGPRPQLDLVQIHTEPCVSAKTLASPCNGFMHSCSSQVFLQPINTW